MSTRDKITELLRDSDPDVQQAMMRVYALEKEHVYQLNPRGIKEQVTDVFKQVIR